jgi:antitoxin VapB
MALYVKDPEVDRLATRLATLRKLTKTEAVHQALLNELTRERATPSLVEIGVDYCRALRARGDASAVAVADKAFIDGLYEGDGNVP